MALLWMVSATAWALTAQTITFGALPGKSFGAAPFTISATASSGLTVAFTSQTTPVCTVSSTTVTLAAAGTCTIQTSQAGNATYAAAPNVNQSFTVAKGAQTITFAALSGKTYGAAPFAVSATASSGLAVAFSSTTTTICTVSGSTVTLVAAGTRTIQADEIGIYDGAVTASQAVTLQAITHACAVPLILITSPISGDSYETPASIDIYVNYAESQFSSIDLKTHSKQRSESLLRKIFGNPRV